MTGEKPLKIVIAADTYHPDVNGAAVFCYRLATAMTERGHEVHVMATRPDKGPTVTEVLPEATVHRLRSHAVPTHEYFRICFPWEVNPEIKQLLDEIKPDVVHAQCHYMIGQGALAFANKRGSRTVATNHFMPENLDPFLPFPQWFKKIVARNSWRDMGKIMGKANVVTTPTPLAARAMTQYARLDKVLPLSNGIDSSNYELGAAESIDRNPYPTILFVGRLAVEKNVNELIEALTLMKTVPDAHLEVIGGGEQRAPLEKLAREKGVASRVHFLGHVDDEELRRAYLRCDVFCQPGTAELQSLVTLEALSASKPVVLANAMALPHLVDDGVNGYLFEPGDLAGLAGKLDSILGMTAAEQAVMGKAGHAKAALHSHSKTMDTFEAIYRGAVAEDFLP
ncbi:glycosyltransferase [Paeniglutamicibacter sulfureus]|uniref:D-inositol 3-phosphate glycosyltransferase n=1 Tax=Paeniglutamicibacter sulfureus TaxID=43666 RepID=A0ABU2BI11_9MICC|nr:glycosyltransferase [Paeniglutamicibacter sulfureus]MDO2933076.1 glycosyltransferase [Paeniglutamicibacter sulfureus]MDR7357373.1 glycosyltransferase involved in cell wall biosynthesis [Paeniglutamicibacter sulfureus]